MPTTVPNTFAGQDGTVPAAELDENFAALATAIDAGDAAAEEGAVATVRGDVDPSLDTLEKIGVQVSIARQQSADALATAQQSADDLNAAVTGGLAQIDAAVTAAVEPGGTIETAVDAAVAAGIIEINAAGDPIIAAAQAAADSAAESALVAGGIGFAFSTTTADSDPGPGKLRFNNAVLASVTFLYIDDTEVGGGSVAAWLDSFDDSAAAIRGYVHVQQPGATGFAVFGVTGAVVNGTGYRKVPVTFISGAILPSEDQRVTVLFAPAGATGIDGATGLPGAGVPLLFSTTTTDSDPGAGTLRFNNGTLASITQIFVDNTAVGGGSITAWLDGFDNADAAVHGQITITEPASGKFYVFNVTGSVTDGTGYRKIAVAFVSGSSSLPANGGSLVMAFTANGADADATQIAYTAEAYRFGKAQFDYQVGNGLRDYPVNQQASRLMSLNGNTRNADGTITIAAGSWIVTQDWTTPDAVNKDQLWYFWSVSADGDTSTDIRLQASFNNAAVILPSQTLTRPAPGVVKLVFRNWTGVEPGSAYGWFNVRYYNDGSVPRTIRPPEAYLTDHALLPRIIRFDETVVVPSPPIREFDPFWERWSMARQARVFGERQVSFAADSVAGSSGNSGTSIFAPKQVLAGITMSQGSILALARGSTFRENLPTFSGSLIRGQIVTDYADGAATKPLPIVSGLDTIPNTVGGGTTVDWTDNGDGSWRHEWSGTVGADGNPIANNGYDEVYIAFVDTTRETSEPVAARQQPVVKASQAAVAAANNSQFITNLGGGNWRADVRFPDGLAPNLSIWRAEKVKRYCPGHFGSSYEKDGSAFGLMMIGPCFGYGLIAAPKRFIGERLALIHASAHHVVAGGGALRYGVSYSKGKRTTSTTHYAVDATGLRWSLADWFYFDTGEGHYSHNGSDPATNQYERGSIRNSVSYHVRGGGEIAGALYGGGYGAVSSKALDIENVYIRGSTSALSFGNETYPLPTTGKNVIIRESARVNVPSNVPGVFAAMENWSDPTNANNRGCRVDFSRSNSVADGWLIWLNGVDPGNGLTDFTGEVMGLNPKGVLRNSIIVLGSGLTSPYLVSGHPAGATLFTEENNLFIHLGGSTLTSIKTGSTPQTTWAGYLSLFGQGAGSGYIDARDDPRGEAAFFRDLPNGDCRWAQTRAAAEAAAFCDANGIGQPTIITRWPEIPTVDKAVRLLAAA